MDLAVFGVFRPLEEYSTRSPFISTVGAVRFIAFCGCVYTIFLGIRLSSILIMLYFLCGML
jgi:hypothetical protein